MTCLLYSTGFPYYRERCCCDSFSRRKSRKESCMPVTWMLLLGTCGRHVRSAGLKERFMWHGIAKDVKEQVSVVENITPCTTCTQAVVKGAPYNYSCNVMTSCHTALSFFLTCYRFPSVTYANVYEPEAYNWYSTTVPSPSESTLASAWHCMTPSDHSHLWLMMEVATS